MEVEIENSSYGSIDNSKPLFTQKKNVSSIHSQPLSEVKYESLNEIHLDFSKAKPFHGGLRSVNSNSSISKERNKNISSTPLVKSPKLNSTNLKNIDNSSYLPSINNNPSSTTFNNKNYINSLHSNSTNSVNTNNSSSTYTTLHSSNLQSTNTNLNSNINTNVNTIINNNDADISLKSRMKNKKGANVFIDTKLKNDISSSVASSANTTFNAANINPTPIVSNTDITPSTEITLDSPFLFRNFDNTQTPVSNTSSPTSETPKTANTSFSAVHLFKSILSPISKKQGQATNLSEKIFNIEKDEFTANDLSQFDDTIIVSNSKSILNETTNNKSNKVQQNSNALNSNKLSSFSNISPTLNFKSFQNFDHLKDQLEKSAKENASIIQSDLNDEYSREQIIRDKFSEEYREEYNVVNVSPLKKGNNYILATGKDDPFNPYNDSNYNPSQVIEDNSDSFLTTMNNQPHFDKVQDFNFDKQTNSKKIKIDWKLKTDSEKYISRLESKMDKVKKAPKEIVIEIPEYDDYDYKYNQSLDEESELLSDCDSINQPLIKRSDAGARIRRRKRIMHALKDNKKLIISLFSILLIVAISLWMFFLL